MDLLSGRRWGGTRASLLLPLLLAQEPTPQLAVVLARVLHGEAPPSLGPFCMASLETMQALMHLRGQLEPQWKMLRVAGETGRPGSA